MKQLFIAAVLLVTGCLHSNAQATSTITVDGTNRTYIAYAPKDLGENRPLFIFCHGYSQDAGWMINNEFKNDNVSMQAVCDTAKFVVVFPNGIDKSWDTGGDRDINFVKALIDKMSTQYKIDRNRVYLGGFSMGGMFTYHAMNKIPDLIAAFVPVSGYPMGGASANANVRPIPIMQIHGTGDGTCAFSGVQPALNVWINHNNCPTTAKTINSYNGFGGAKLHIWGPGDDGVEVRLLELADKGHWICKETQVYTGKEMWNFCKRYSLNKTSPSVSITSPKGGGTYTSFAAKGEATFPDITIEASAYDTNGTIAQVDFYDNNTLIATVTAEPYKATLSGATAGTHTLKVVATDNDGETGSTSTSVTFTAPQAAYVLSSKFTEANSVPAGWVTYDSDEKRIGYVGGFGQGCRILQMTGSPRDFTYGLYIRNKNGQAHQGYAKYGLPEANCSMTLARGHYTLKYRICNWNREEFSKVEVAVEKLGDGEAVAQVEYMPTVNVGNVTSNSFSGSKQETFEFDVYEGGNYVLAIYSDASGWSDALIGYLSLAYSGEPVTAITTVTAADSPDRIYNLNGQAIANPSKGIFIKNGKKVVLK